MPEAKELAVIGNPAVEFDYAGFTAEERKAAKRDEEQIKGLVQTGKAAAIKIGQILARAKDRLEHGKFEAWVQASFGHMFSLRTALRYRRDAIALLEEPATKSDKLSDLPNTKKKNEAKVDKSAGRAAAAATAVAVLNRCLEDADLQEFMSNYREAGPSAFSKALDPYSS